MFNEGDVIGSYRLVSMLGAGGMATVYKAYHPKLDRYVALKMMHNSFLSDPQFVARFEREAQIVARLEHPNIVPVHDFAEYEGQPYLVMRFISGITLRDALNDGALELQDIMAMMPRIADALDYAHRQGVLHRDIKPSNIMVEKDGTPYLTDFGLARTVQAGESSLSQGVLIGTPAYMSPEQGAGERELDSRSDLYSLGIILYELVVGKVPFSGTTTYKILHEHQTEPPPIPSSINPEIPPAVEMVLLKALSKEPEDRYSSASEMVNELQETFTASGVRRLNAGERHSIVISLEKSNVDTKSKPLPISRTVLPNERALTKGSAPTAKTGYPVQGQLVGEGSAVPVSSVARSSGDRLVYVLVGMLLVVVIVLVAALALNGQNNAETITPTAVAALNPADTPSTATELPTRGTPPAVVTTEEATPAGQGQGGNPQGNRPQGGNQPNLPPLPENIQQYNVPLYTESEARAYITAHPDNPVGYLALARAILGAPGDAPLAEVNSTIAAGAAIADNTDTFYTSLIMVLSTSRTPPELLFNAYNDALTAIIDPNLRSAIANRIGFQLYVMGRSEQRVPLRVFENLVNLVSSNFDPLMRVLLARAAITHGRLTTAELILAQTGVDFPVARLVQGDLFAAQDEMERAREAWQTAQTMEGASQWVQDLTAESIASSP